MNLRDFTNSTAVTVFQIRHNKYQLKNQLIEFLQQKTTLGIYRRLESNKYFTLTIRVNINFFIQKSHARYRRHRLVKHGKPQMGTGWLSGPLQGCGL